MSHNLEQQIIVIKNLLKEMNQTWYSGSPQDLKKYFHEKIGVKLSELFPIR